MSSTTMPSRDKGIAKKRHQLEGAVQKGVVRRSNKSSTSVFLSSSPPKVSIRARGKPKKSAAGTGIVVDTDDAEVVGDEGKNESSTATDASSSSSSSISSSTAVTKRGSKRAAAEVEVEASAKDVCIPDENSHLPDHPDIGIIVVLEEELTGIRIALEKDGGKLGKPLPPLNGRVVGTNLFWLTTYRGYNLVICKTDEQGQREPQPAVERLVNHFHVSELVLIGVSGGLSDSRVGDVVIASDVDDIAHRGDVIDLHHPDGSTTKQHRYGGAHFLPTDTWVVQAKQFRHVQSDAFCEWKNDCDGILSKTVPLNFLTNQSVFRRGGVEQHVGLIASGVDVVKSEQEKSDLKNRSRLFLAVDTESAGFSQHVLRCLRDCAEGETLRFCVLRGISDMAGEQNKQEMEAMKTLTNPPFTDHQKVLQVIATYNAFTMFGAFIKAGMFRSAAGGTVEEFLRLEQLKEEAVSRFDLCKGKALAFMRILAAGSKHISIKSRDGLVLLEYRKTDKKGRRTLTEYVKAVKSVVKDDSKTWRDIEDAVTEPIVVEGGSETVKSITMMELSNKKRKPIDVSAAARVKAAAAKKGDEDVDEGEEEGSVR